MEDLNFILKKFVDVSLSKPLLIQGLPGMGNVGKITVDFLLQSLKAKRVYEIRSSLFPSYAFVTQNNILEAPRMEVYHKKIKKRDILFLTGDVQPFEDHASYLFSHHLLSFLKKLHVEEIITLGGIGLEHPPHHPHLYLAGTDKKMLRKYQGRELKEASSILLGPILGMTGLTLALSKEYALPGVSFLVETTGTPGHLGIKESKELIQLLNKKLGLGINIKEFEKETKFIETQLHEIFEKPFEEESHSTKKEVTNYIG